MGKTLPVNHSTQISLLAIYRSVHPEAYGLLLLNFSLIFAGWRGWMGCRHQLLLSVKCRLRILIVPGAPGWLSR